MAKKDFLRLALVMNDQTATTVDKYICKLVESVLFDASGIELSALEICEQIKEKYQLEFDILEIEKAVSAKSRGRIIYTNRKYQLSPKALNQLKGLNDPLTLLNEYVAEFLHEFNLDCSQEALFDKLQEYLYYSFNSSIENLMGLLEIKPLSEITGFSVSNEMVQLINDFIAWDNAEKNKLLYDLVSLSYEYCMLTTKKDTLLSKRIFKGKRFLLDSNIIFRMAGINKDERQFVTTSFTKKCEEVGIDLFYSSETLTELYRVIEGQIKYIRYLTQGQEPLPVEVLKKIEPENEINDFYAIYYNWCKEPQNHYDDYLSFQKYLIGRIRDVICNLKCQNIPNAKFSRNSESFTSQCKSLEKFKKAKRPLKPVSKESIQTDINNIFYIYSLRNTIQSQSFWQINEYIVSADQLLTNWAQQEYSGIPIVVIPSTWLSILLRFAGRTDNDYKAYCLFMGLRQHRTDEEKIVINSATLLATLAQKTSDVYLKQQIIEEILNYKSSYSFDSNEDYESAIDDAFEHILQRAKEELRTELTDAFNLKEKDSAEQIRTLNEQMDKMSTEDEYTVKLANNKADSKVEKWERLRFLTVLIPALSVIAIFAITMMICCKIGPVYGLVSKFEQTENASGATPWAIYIFCASTLLGAFLNFIIIAPLKYLSSNERKQSLIKKYIKESKKYLK